MDHLKVSVDKMVAMLLASTYDATDDQEPNDDEHGFCESRGVLSLFAFDCNGTEELSAHVEVEDCADSYRTKEPHEQGLPGLVDLRNLLVQGEHNWQAT